MSVMGARLACTEEDGFDSRCVHYGFTHCNFGLNYETKNN